MPTKTYIVYTSPNDSFEIQATDEKDALVQAQKEIDEKQIKVEQLRIADHATGYFVY